MNQKTYRMMRNAVTRRRFLQGSGAMLGTMATIGPQRAMAAPFERKFLFFYAGGGWDTTTIFDPHLSDGVDLDPDTMPVTLGGLTYTGGVGRENTERFFRRWGQYTATLNGVNVHSVGHDSAQQFVMTGTSASSYSDWPTLLAGNSRMEHPLPHVVFSGPAYAGTYGSALVRAGGGTLLDLIDGSVVGYTDRPAPVMPTPADSMLDAYVYRRAADFAKLKTGLGRDRADGLLANLERAMELEGRRFEAGLDDLGRGILDQAIKATELFRLGLSRCAMISIPGGYDTHGNNTPQGINQDAFMGVLDQVFDHLTTTPGHAAKWLVNEVVLVAVSEFGRTPKLNGAGGKDHWPFNSYLVAGGGVNGGRTMGKTDGSLIAEPVSFQTGLASGTGEMLNCEHVGTALIKLGGLDSNRFLPGVQSFDALLRDA